MVTFFSYGTCLGMTAHRVQVDNTLSFCSMAWWTWAVLGSITRTRGLSVRCLQAVATTSGSATTVVTWTPIRMSIAQLMIQLNSIGITRSTRWDCMTCLPTSTSFSTEHKRRKWSTSATHKELRNSLSRTVWMTSLRERSRRWSVSLLASTPETQAAGSLTSNTS